jgi:hypothetical protein
LLLAPLYQVFFDSQPAEQNFMTVLWWGPGESNPVLPPHSLILRTESNCAPYQVLLSSSGLWYLLAELRKYSKGNGG